MTDQIAPQALKNTIVLILIDVMDLIRPSAADPWSISWLHVRTKPQIPDPDKHPAAPWPCIQVLPGWSVCHTECGPFIHVIPYPSWEQLRIYRRVLIDAFRVRKTCRI